MKSLQKCNFPTFILPTILMWYFKTFIKMRWWKHSSRWRDEPQTFRGVTHSHQHINIWNDELKSVSVITDCNRPSVVSGSREKRQHWTQIIQVFALKWLKSAQPIAACDSGTPLAGVQTSLCNSGTKVLFSARGRDFLLLYSSVLTAEESFSIHIMFMNAPPHMHTENHRSQTTHTHTPSWPPWLITTAVTIHKALPSSVEISTHFS